MSRIIKARILELHLELNPQTASQHVRMAEGRSGTLEYEHPPLQSSSELTGCGGQAICQAARPRWGPGVSKLHNVWIFALLFPARSPCRAADRSKVDAVYAAFCMLNHIHSLGSKLKSTPGGIARVYAGKEYEANTPILGVTLTCAPWHRCEQPKGR